MRNGDGMVNIKDVAKRAGVSMMTVSRVINNNGPVKDSTRKKVEKVIDELDYIPNQIAKSLVNSASKTIGVLFSNIFNPVYSSIISGLEEKANESGYNIIISNASDYKSSTQALNMLVSKMVDGFIILPIEPKGLNSNAFSKQALDEFNDFYEYLKKFLSKRKLPCVVIDIDLNNDSDHIRFVGHDYAAAARIGIEYLLGCGFKNIVQINSELKSGIWQERQSAYETAMREAGLEENICTEYCSNSTQAAYDLVRDMLKRGDRPEVFYCANDIMAIGAIQAINSCGLSVPKDISVMGNDGIYVGEMLVPALTTVDIDSVKIGEKAMEICHNMIEGCFGSRKIYIEPHLLIRESVAYKKEI